MLFMKWLAVIFYSFFFISKYMFIYYHCYIVVIYVIQKLREFDTWKWHQQCCMFPAYLNPVLFFRFAPPSNGYHSTLWRHYVSLIHSISRFISPKKVSVFGAIIYWVPIPINKSVFCRNPSKLHLLQNLLFSEEIFMDSRNICLGMQRGNNLLLWSMYFLLKWKKNLQNPCVQCMN